MAGRLHAFLLMMLTALLWSTGGLGIKLADATPLTIGGLRSLFAAGVMMIPTVITLRRSGRGTMRSLLTSRTIWGAAVAYVVMVLAFVFAVKWSSAANAILIQYTGPIYVAVLSWPVLRERMRPEDGFAAVGCGIGLCVFFWGEIGGEGSHLWGNVLAVLSSFGFGALPIFLKLEQRRKPAALPAAGIAPAFAMTLGNLLAFLVTLPFIVQYPPKSGFSLATIALLGVFQIGIPYLLYGIAVQKLRALESSLLACVEPILSPLWVFLVMHEVPSRGAIVGGSLILASVTLQGVIASRR